LSSLQIERTGYLTRWVNATVINKRWALRAGVLSLAFGVSFIAAPFIASSRVPSIPVSPAAPAIPGQVASGFDGPARELFAAQVDSFMIASEARNKAVAAASNASRNAASRDDKLNRRTLYLALICLATALIGPWLYEMQERTLGSNNKKPGSRGILASVAAVIRPRG
jgi:hypothetical protein